MITQLSGTITHKDLEYVLVDVHGVGYKVFVTPDTLANVSNNAQVTLWTHLAVRENAMDLYGFTSKEDLNFFELLLSISGVGPKSALAILRLADVPTLEHAIAEGDTSYLTKVSGIGQKSAKKIVLELQDKIGAIHGAAALKDDTDTLDILIAMGYSQTEARGALKKISKDTVGAQARLKEALQFLGQ